MTIPAGIRHFPQATLLVAVDSHHVKGYLALKDEAHNVFVVDVPSEKGSMEKQHIPTGDTHTDAHIFHDLVAKQGAAEIAKHAKDALEIALFIPARFKNEFMSALPKDVQAKVKHIVEADVTRETPVELAKRLTM
jgi:hypothetical protein